MFSSNGLAEIPWIASLLIVGQPLSLLRLHFSITIEFATIHWAGRKKDERSPLLSELAAVGSAQFAPSEEKKKSFAHQTLDSSTFSKSSTLIPDRLRIWKYSTG